MNLKIFKVFKKLSDDQSFNIEQSLLQLLETNLEETAQKLN